MTADDRGPYRDCSIQLHVLGIPSPQGSKTKMPNGAMVEGGSPTGRAKLANWRNDVRAAAEKWLAENGEPDPLEGPLVAGFTFRMPRPKARKNDRWTPTKPDLSKLVRATEDALTGIIWRDDALLVGCTAAKEYVGSGVPGAHIAILRPIEWQLSIPKKYRSTP